MSQQQIMDLLRECIPAFFILSDENRHKILNILVNEGRQNVNGLTGRLHLSRPAVSHHLKLMLDAGMVSVEQTGKERFYSANLKQSIDKIEEMLELLRRSCQYPQA